MFTTPPVCLGTSKGVDTVRGRTRESEHEESDGLYRGETGPPTNNSGWIILIVPVCLGRTLSEIFCWPTTRGFTVTLLSLYLDKVWLLLLSLYFYFTLCTRTRPGTNFPFSTTFLPGLLTVVSYTWHLVYFQNTVTLTGLKLLMCWQGYLLLEQGIFMCDLIISHLPVPHKLDKSLSSLF